MNNLEFAFTLNINGSNSLDAWALDTDRQPVIQIQALASEVMQVASLCYTVKPALGGSGHFFQAQDGDALELQMFELAQWSKRFRVKLKLWLISTVPPLGRNSG